MATVTAGYFRIAGVEIPVTRWEITQLAPEPFDPIGDDGGFLVSSHFSRVISRCLIAEWEPYWSACTDPWLMLSFLTGQDESFADWYSPPKNRKGKRDTSQHRTKSRKLNLFFLAALRSCPFPNLTLWDIEKAEATADLYPATPPEFVGYATDRWNRDAPYFIVTMNGMEHIQMTLEHTADVPVLPGILRDIFTPFGHSDVTACRTPTVVATAERIYREGDWASMPILADSLEEAGASVDVLAHCRRGGCVRGCWLIDALTVRGR